MSGRWSGQLLCECQEGPSLVELLTCGFPFCYFNQQERLTAMRGPT